MMFFHRNIILGRTIIPWDIRQYHLPLALFFSKSLRDGELPFWNPFDYCGYPFAANVQTAIYYPPRLLAMLLGGATSGRMLYCLELDVIAHVLLAGIFCYLLLREFGLNRIIATLGASAFQLGGFFASQVEHVGAVEGMAWLPLIWLLLLRGARSFTLRNWLLLSLALSMTILSGFTPVTAIAFFSSAVWAVLLVVTRRADGKLLAQFAGSCACTLLLCAVVLAPSAEMTLHSVSRYRSDWIGNGGGLPLKSLQSLVWPNSYRILDRGFYHEKLDITLTYLYCGTATILGALVFLVKRQSRFPWAMGAMLAVALLFMLGESTPFGMLYGAVMPPLVLGAIYPQEWLGPFSLTLCVVGACGWASLVKRRVPQLLLVAVTIFDLTWFGSNRPFNSTTVALDPGVTERTFAGSAPLLRAVRSFARQTVPSARTDTIGDSLDWVGSAPLIEVPTAGGADPMAPIRMIQVRLALTTGYRWGYYYQANTIRTQVMEAMNVCCILTRKRLSEKQLNNSSYTDVVVVPGGFLYSTRAALPRFYLVHNTESARDMAQAAQLLRRNTWQPRASAIVENFALASVANADVSGDAVLVRQYRRNAVSLETDSRAPAFLASSESNYPGWRATVDGSETPIYYTNVAFRGIALPAGKHRVEFTFRPAIVVWSFAVSVAAWGAFAVVFWKSGRQPN